MGYYADLIKQKQEKKNFRDPLGLGLTFHELGTPDDYKAKFKKGDKVKLRYGSGFKGEGVIVEGPIKMRASLTPTYRIKLTDGKVVGRYEEELAKNSKEETKENGRIEEMYREIQELKKKGLSSLDIDKYYAAINYRKTAEQYLEEFKKTKNTDYKYAAEGQLRKAEQLEREYKKHLHNADEEKENESPQSATARRKALQKLEDAQKKANWWGDTTMQKLKHDLTYADEETLLDLVEVLDRYLPKFEAKVKSFGNSNEEKGYYAKLAEEKASRKN